MKACFISDTHLRDISLPEADITFHCGDFLMAGTWQEWRKNLVWLKREREKSKHFIVTFGNHDRYCYEELSLVREELNDLGIVALVDEHVYLEGLHIWGTPWVPFISGHWAWECQKGGSLKDKWERIPKGLDILLSHSPGKGFLDQSIFPNGTKSRLYGDPDLVTAVMEKRLRFWASGHIHSGHGLIDHEGIKIMNASLLDEEYKVAYEPIVLEI